MAAPAAARRHPLSAQVIGQAFVAQYYRILQLSPERAHSFYKDVSKLGRPEEDGSMSITTTIDAIKTKIVSLKYDEHRFQIESLGAQDSFDGGIAVTVTGCLMGKDNSNPRRFCQSFYLAPQEIDFFLLNDMFYYI